ncbi:MAG: GNAT family N-acetyltransferase [Candidatus Omnitrophica bacterium]|jgi:GNAT superfamily N-acetyltransferase|nr:GNAT family N-acetyltransferase [Candidatus Omnitrophota bacterium]MDD5512152.1 GNAT family N-acetyltransferase [Candidatus Omnitrophota bacterium]
MKDLILRHNDCLFKFTFLPWDSDYFGVVSYLFDWRNSKIGSHFQGLGEFLAKGLPPDSFITAKIPSTEESTFLNLLIKCGFDYIDTGVILEMESCHLAASKKRASICEVKKMGSGTTRGIPYNELGSTFSFTRFHQDAHIPKNKARGVWINLFKNFVPKGDNAIFLAKHKDRIIGALLLKKSKLYLRRYLEICFLSVLPDFQEKGAGAALIEAAVRTAARKRAGLLVGTQFRNLGALNFYIKKGFRIKETFVVLHRWQS